MKDMTDVESSSMSLNVTVDTVVLPGDIIGTLSSNAHKTIIGPGLRQEKLNIIATKAGLLRYKLPNKVWLDNQQKRYVPVKEELVIGIVTDKMSEEFKVDIGGSMLAHLNSLAFEGATKRNRPNLAVGALIYCRLTIANRDMEPEASCLTAQGKASGLGALAGGFMFECSLGLVRQLLAPDCPVLKALGAYFAFETAIGMNGRIWVKCRNVSQTILVANALANSEFMSGVQAKIMVDRLADQLGNL